MIKKLYRRFLAIFRLSNKAICEESSRLGYYDYHDYTDSIEGYPDHFVALHRKRCGKEFYI